MCEEHIVDMLDPQTLIVKPNFIECMREQGLELYGQPWGDFIVINMEDLEPSKREKLSTIARQVYSKLHPPKPRTAQTQQAAVQQPQARRILITWDPRKILDGYMPRGGGYKRVISLYLDAKLVEELDKIAREHHMNRSELVARLIAAFLEAYKSIK